MESDLDQYYRESFSQAYAECVGFFALSCIMLFAFLKTLCFTHEMALSGDTMQTFGSSVFAITLFAAALACCKYTVYLYFSEVKRCKEAW